MLTQASLLHLVRQNDWFTSGDLKDAYFQIPIYPPHRKYLRYAFQGICYEHCVLPFGLSLSPRVFVRCTEVWPHISTTGCCWHSWSRRPERTRVFSYLFIWSRFHDKCGKEHAVSSTGHNLSGIISWAIMSWWGRTIQRRWRISTVEGGYAPVSCTCWHANWSCGAAVVSVPEERHTSQEPWTQVRTTGVHYLLLLFWSCTDYILGTYVTKIVVVSSPEKYYLITWIKVILRYSWKYLGQANLACMAFSTF